MPKETKERHKKEKGLTDKELIEKYGADTSPVPFEVMINTMLSKPSKNAPAKIAKRI